MTAYRKLKLLFYGVLLAILFFGLIQIFVNKSGLYFPLELAGLIFLVLLALIGIMGFAYRWGELVLFMLFLFYLGNLVLVWYFKGTFYLVLAVLALLGAVVSFPLWMKPKQPREAQPPPVEEETAAPKSAAKKPATQYTPGKFVASKQSNVYHLPTCEWAKKIEPERRVWFKSKEEAWEKGYKKHSCV